VGAAAGRDRIWRVSDVEREDAVPPRTSTWGWGNDRSVHGDARAGGVVDALGGGDGRDADVGGEGGRGEAEG
jgi:hypothetical protein